VLSLSARHEGSARHVPTHMSMQQDRSSGGWDARGLLAVWAQLLQLVLDREFLHKPDYS
jgi:hypothetical protein